MLSSPTLWKKFVPFPTTTHLSVIQFSQLLAWCSKDWENGNIFFHDAVPNGRRVPGDSSCKGKRQFPLPAEKSYVTFEMCNSSWRTGDLSSQREKIKRRPCSHLHPPPSTNTHQSHKCLGKAFLNYRGVCHSARKWNASQLQTTLERISELISCDKTSVHFDMHAGSSEIWIHVHRLWNLWFPKVTFMAYALNFVGGSLWDLLLWLKLGSQIVPQTSPTKM